MKFRHVLGLLIGAVGLFEGLPALASAPSLFWVAQQYPSDRALLLKSGVPLVQETPSGYLVLGDGARVPALLASMGYDPQILSETTDRTSYFAVFGPESLPLHFPSSCGKILLADGSWTLLEIQEGRKIECRVEPPFSLRLLELSPLGLPVPPPSEYAGLDAPIPETLVTRRQVFDVLARISPEDAVTNWDSIIASAPTRYSQAPGCWTAAASLLEAFRGFGLEASLQEWSSGSAPNVSAVIPGQVSPEKVVIAIAHLDDMPGYGQAPGANDNASGCAMLLTAAQALAPYLLANSVKFLAVTGEEQGLLGSSWYAADAESRDEHIVAVLNADMIGWQGDKPGAEDLDINYNDSSRWLGELFEQCALEYQTGCIVDAFKCRLEASDHAPFWHKGFSAVCGITDNEGFCGHRGSYPYYHRGSDSRENCGDAAFFKSAVNAYVASLAHLAEPLCRNVESPAGLVAVPDGENRIRLSWEPVPEALGYSIERARGFCGRSQVFRPLAETCENEYVDTSVCGDFSFAYRVRARGSEVLCDSAPTGCVGARATGSCLRPPGSLPQTPVLTPALLK